MDRNLYEKNMTVLKQKYPQVAEALIQGVYEQETAAIGVTEIEGRSILYAVRDEKQYQLDSLYDSDALMDIWRNQLEAISYQTTFIWFGLGNGMYLRKLLETTDDELPIVIYEPSLSVIAAAMESFDIGALLENYRVSLIVPGYTVKFDEKIFQILNFENKGYLQYGAYLNYNRVFVKEAEQFLDELQLAINSINSTQTVLKRFGEAYFHNTLSNLPYLICGHTLEQLYYALPKNVPAIIVAAGPSLDKNIQELKKAKNRAFIIAVDTAVRALLKQDILPDLFVTVDGKKLASHFTDKRLRTIPVVCCLQGNRDALGVHIGKKFFFDDENAYIREFFKKMGKEFAGLSTGGSVANDAFSLADTLRFQTIILVGQDLAYTNFQSHAQGTISAEVEAGIGDRDTVSMEGYYGETVVSSTEFQLYRKWFEDIIIEKPYLKVINATEGGANIRGAENLSLSETLKRECHDCVDFSKLIEQIPPFFTQQEQSEFYHYLSSAVTKLEEIVSDIKLGMCNYETMRELILRENYRSEEIKTITKKNGELSGKIDREPVMCFVQYRLQEINMTLLDQKQGQIQDEKQELLQAVNQGEEYLKKVYQAIEDVIPILRKYFIEESMEKILEKNKMLAEIQGLLGQMQLKAQKAMRYLNEE